MSRSGVRLYVADSAPLGDDEVRAQCRALLPRDEVEYADRYRMDEDRALSLLARMLLRTALSEAVPAVAFRMWRFRRADRGKPEALAPDGSPAPAVNLSHTHGRVAVAVAPPGVDVGVDLENTGRRHGPLLPLAERFFSPVEAAHVREADEAGQERLFFTYWTLKEAYLKACGTGLTVPLDRFTMVLHDDAPPTIRFADEEADHPDRWRFAMYRDSNPFPLACAVAARDATPPVIAAPVAMGMESLLSAARADR